MNLSKKHNIKKAAAITYNNKYSIPTVNAIGLGQIAEKIISTAKENNVPIVENNELTESLAALSIGQPIPEGLYEAVAQILSFIYNMNDKIP